jgi:hypothetical protein
MENKMKILWFVVIIQSIALCILFSWNHELRKCVYRDKIITKEITVEAIKIEKNGIELGRLGSNSDNGFSLEMFSADKNRHVQLGCFQRGAILRLRSGNGNRIVLSSEDDKLYAEINSYNGSRYGIFYDKHPSWEKPYWNHIAPEQNEIFGQGMQPVYKPKLDDDK